MIKTIEGQFRDGRWYMKTGNGVRYISTIKTSDATSARGLFVHFVDALDGYETPPFETVIFDGRGTSSRPIPHQTQAEAKAVHMDLIKTIFPEEIH